MYQDEKSIETLLSRVLIGVFLALCAGAPLLFLALGRFKVFGG